MTSSSLAREIAKKIWPAIIPIDEMFAAEIAIIEAGLTAALQNQHAQIEKVVITEEDRQRLNSEVYAAVKHFSKLISSDKSEYIRENSRHGGASAWAELLDAVDARQRAFFPERYAEASLLLLTTQLEEAKQQEAVRAQLVKELRGLQAEAWRWAQRLTERAHFSIGELTSVASCLSALYGYGAEVYLASEPAKVQSEIIEQINTDLRIRGERISDLHHQLADLRRQLQIYGTHAYDCACQNTDKAPACTCGFTSVVSEADASDL